MNIRSKWLVQCWNFVNGNCRAVGIAALLLVATWAAAPAVAAELQAGVARVDLTPPADMKAALGGYGERASRPAEGVHDRVLAKALVLTDGSSRFALVTADILAFPPPFKPALVARLVQTGWTADQIMLLPSHSHASIDMSAINPNNIFGVPQIGIYQPELLEFVVASLAQVIQQAAQQLTPVVVGTSSQQLIGWSRNRRSADGPVDPELIVTRFDKSNGQPLAVLFHFTAHPTFLQPEHMLFSGEWPGHAQRTIEALVGEGVTAMYYNGAEGDQSPIARPESGPSRWEVAERYGRELGIQAWKTWQTTATQPNGVLAYCTQSIDLPATVWHADFLQTGGTEYNLTEKLLSQMLPIICPATTSSISLRIHDLVIVGVPGEMSAELGLQIKSAAASTCQTRYVAIGGLADQWLSYILSADEYRRGGYEASVSFYGDTLGQTIVNGVLQGAPRLPK